jgi:two-component system, sensor histidine kinase and response regulator
LAVMCARCPYLKRGRCVAEPKELVAAAIAEAQANLEEALSGLEKMPAFDAGAVAFAAHALNNYLTVTGATVELILLRLAGHADADLRTWLEGIQHANYLMARIVVQLRDSAVTTEPSLRLEKFELPKMVFRACNYYQRVAERKSIRLAGGSPIDVPPVWGDLVLVAAVLDNLLSNAVKYSPPNTQIGVLLREERGWVVCSVQDEGPGLSPEDQAKLFRRGVRLTPKPTGGEPGTGYGLAVAKELVERLGGTIWCQSELGKGTCFSFRLPAYQEQTHGAVQKLHGPHPESGVAGRTNNSS